jgi:protein-glutamine gamma-glutamyltransferase
VGGRGVNATAAALRRASWARPAARARVGLPTLTILRVIAFSAIALLAGMRFAALLAHPPVLRVFGVVATAAAGGGALAATRVVPRRRGLPTSLRLLIVTLSAYLSLRAAGAPAGLLWPWRWARLAHDIGRGTGALDGLWPYDGELAQARMAVMLALPTALVPASVLAFWPGPWRAGARRVAALAALLALYVTAAMNEPQTGWRVQGMILLALLCLWGWAWRPRPADAARALTWVLLGAVVALVGAGVVHSGAPLLDYRDWNPFGPAFPATTFNWNQVYGPLPWSNSTETMVEVGSRTPHLWRATTLDRFDGVRFLRSDATPPNTDDLSGVAADPRWVTQTTFTIRGLGGEQLLSPGQIVRASIQGVAVPRLDAVAPDGTVALSRASPQSGDRYTVTAYAPQPSAAEMRRAPRAFAAAFAPYTEFDLAASGGGDVPTSAANRAGVARIEASPYAGVYQLARRLGRGAPSSYDVVARVEAFLRRGFTYDEDPPRSAYPLVSFLFTDRAGYCQQFSGAMTLLLRMDGIPARVAAGFLPGSRNPSSGLYEVSAQDAHAWVEVYFAGIGWVPFDPTPAKPAGGSFDALSLEHGAAGAAARHRAPPLRRRPGQRVAAASAASSARGGAGTEIGIGLAAALLLAALAWWAGTVRIERALAGDARGAVRELSRALPRVGLSLGAGTTLAELERGLALSCGPAASRYVRLLSERRYAPRADPRSPTPRDRRRLRRALCRRRGPLARIAVLLAIPPGTRRPRRHAP